MASSRDLSDYVQGWRRRFRQAEEERQSRAEQARARLPELVNHLVEQYGVRRVWLHGSLAEGGFHGRSDIDLVVEGLPGGTALFRAGAELEDLARPFEVDLVPYEEARAELRDRVRREGEVLYDRGES